MQDLVPRPLHLGITLDGSTGDAIDGDLPQTQPTHADAEDVPDCGGLEGREKSPNERTDLTWKQNNASVDMSMEINPIQEQRRSM
jgi:hypothetical protein